MKRSLLLAFLLAGLVRAAGQSLSTVNLQYWYEAGAEVSLSINPVRKGKQMLVFYTMSLRDSTILGEYTLAWEKRNSFNQQKGEGLSPSDSTLATTAGMKRGVLTFDLPEKPWILMGKVTNTTSQLSWNFFSMLDGNWPVNGFIADEQNLPVNGFIRTGKSYFLVFQEPKPVFGFFYKKPFPAALPPFSTTPTADPFLKADSTFIISYGNYFSPTSPGLYLLQQDSASAQGLAVVCTDANFPKYTRLEKLAPPLIYISTQDEFSELIAANQDKVKFDKVILGITREKDRARSFMRSYFQRVEMANRFFTSFKEGWKTDRGMIYVVFGKPDEVSRTSSNEIWFYKTSRTRFVFVRSGSIFDPDHYVLMRDDRYTNDWFSTIDLWRKSRF